jgi:hypothetical protein
LTLPPTRGTCSRFLSIEEYHRLLTVLSPRDRLILRLFVCVPFAPESCSACAGNVSRERQSKSTHLCIEESWSGQKRGPAKRLLPYPHHWRVNLCSGTKLPVIRHRKR